MEEFNNIKRIKEGDSRYTASMKQIMPPLKEFYCIGDTDLLKSRMVAIVGARKCSEYGKNIAFQLAKSLSRSEITVISGMARGIDSFGHWGALQNGGKTVAVLGCGADICYPAENKKLYQQIGEEGLILTEYPPGTEPKPYFFPQRNRIIAGLAEAIVVVEAGNGSGSLITAELGEELGKKVYSIPGNITSPYSLGTNRLIADGAIPLTVIEDLLQDLGVSGATSEKKEKLSELEKKILQIIEQEGEVTAEGICRLLNRRTAEINGILAILEIKGLIFCYFGKIFLAK